MLRFINHFLSMQQVTPVKPVFVAPVEYSLLILLRLFGAIFSDLDFNQNNFGLNY